MFTTDKVTKVYHNTSCKQVYKNYNLKHNDLVNLSNRLFLYLRFLTPYYIIFDQSYQTVEDNH